MKKILEILKEYKKESILGPLFKLLEASFELFIPLVIAKMIDEGIANANHSLVVQLFVVLCILAAIGLTCAITAQYFAAKAAVGCATKLRSALFSHIQELSHPELDTIGTSTLITRMTSDINQVQSGVNMSLRLFLRSPFIVFGAMIMAFTVDVKAALIFVVTIPALSLVVFGVMLWSVPLYKKVQGYLDQILLKTRENLGGARVIRAFRMEEAETIAYNESNNRLMQMQLMVGRVSALMNPVTYVIINVATLAIIWVGGKQVYAGVLTQGQVVALVNYMSQILVELVKLANLLVNINKSIASANRVEEMFQIQPSIENPFNKAAAEGERDSKESASDYAVEFVHASMNYANAGEEALSDISFYARKGEVIGVIGGTGSGKSSLVNLIPRFYDVSDGTVRVNGRDVKAYDLAQLRQSVGVVMQKAVLFTGTIRDNLLWGNPDATDEMLEKALSIAQAKEIVDSKEDGLLHHVEQGGRNLSGGQKQRLTIARALVKNPDILILDDSASALDFVTDARLRKALKEMQGEKTIFIVSQRTSSIQFADRIVVLDDGKMVGLGTHEELLQNCEVYQEIYASQFRKEDENTKAGKEGAV